METVESLINRLAGTRSAVARVQERASFWREKLRETEEAKCLASEEEAIAVLNTAVADLEEQLRATVLEGYKVTGATKGKGYQVKVYTKLRYDPTEALAWCRQNAKTFVVEQLNVKPFEKVAVDIGAPVVVEKEPRVFIDKELDGTN